MGLTTKQKLLRYHIERRSWVEEQIKAAGINTPVRAALMDSLAFHEEVVEFLSQGG